jgi:hypothetical protein
MTRMEARRRNASALRLRHSQSLPVWGSGRARRGCATEGESTYAGIVRMATEAQSAKSPTIRLAGARPANVDRGSIPVIAELAFSRLTAWSSSRTRCSMRPPCRVSRPCQSAAWRSGAQRRRQCRPGLLSRSDGDPRAITIRMRCKNLREPESTTSSYDRAPCPRPRTAARVAASRA